MILYIYLRNEARTAKVKREINKALSKICSVIKYIGDGIAIHDIELIEIEGIKNALLPFSNKYGENFSLLTTSTDESVEDLKQYNKERYEN